MSSRLCGRAVRVLKTTTAAVMLALAASTCSAWEPNVFPTYNLPQNGPLFRGTTPRFHNNLYQYSIPPALQPDSYIYYRRPPYYSNFPPPYAYPYALPYYAPGVTPQVAPDIYPNYPRQWH